MSLDNFVVIGSSSTHKSCVCVLSGHVLSSPTSAQSLLSWRVVVVAPPPSFNTVHFSNHTGYGKFEGTTETAATFERMTDCMDRNDLMQYSHVLSGYARGGGPAYFLVTSV